MNRRSFIGTLAGSLLAAPLAAQAQHATKVWRVGVLMNLYAPDADPPQALRQRLHDLGYIEGKNLVIDWRYQLGQDNRLPPFAIELVRLKPNAIFAAVTGAIRAPNQATASVRIVMDTPAAAAG